MAELSMSSVVRKILSTDIELPADEVLRRAKARGITASDKSLRANIHTIKSALKKTASASAKVAPAAARETEKPKPARVASSVAVTGATSGLAGVLANVALVSKVVDLSGGLANVRAVAEAVRACGGVDSFLQHLELVAGIRSDKTV